MKLILIDGGPASGKNTLGELLVYKLTGLGEKAVLLDLDTYVEKYNPKWTWGNEQEKEKDQLQARIDISKDIDRYLLDDVTALVIGERFLSKDDVLHFLKRLGADPPVYLYHLNLPFALRQYRLHQRGPHSLIDLEKDQRDRDAVTEWPGCVYDNVHSPEEDASRLLSFIQEGKGAFENEVSQKDSDELKRQHGLKLK
ncbi:MAG: hypothetical protein WCW31_03445 [Patescibacteria group bacterium]|jgi:hypothetical protein